MTNALEWKVERHWAPRHSWLVRRWGAWKRKRDKFDDAGNVIDQGSSSWMPDSGDDLLIGIAIVIGLIVFGLFAWFLLIPLVLVIVDLIFVIIAVALGLFAKVLLRRPWLVTADRLNEHYEWHIVGWRKAGRARDVIAQQLATGKALAAIDIPAV